MFKNLPATVSLVVLLPVVVVDASAQTVPSVTTAPSATTGPPVTTGPAAAGNILNPAISLILSGRYLRTSREPAEAEIRGFALPLAAETGLGARGFGLGESELGLSANIDTNLRGVALLGIGNGEGVSVEEAYIQTTGLGNGLGLKAGRFLSGIGYLNSQHSHVWDFADNPLAYQAMLGTQYRDDGLQLSWLAPTDRYLELGVEVGRGAGFPGNDTAGNGIGMFALSAHTGGDIGESQSWRAGLSLLRAKAGEQALSYASAAGDAGVANFTGSTRVWVADAVWKWAPRGNSSVTNLKVQGEYLRSTRSGSLAVNPGAGDPTRAVGDAAGGAAEPSVGDYRVAQSGWYLQTVYQFMPRWRTGVRIERLSSGSADLGANAPLLDGSRLSSNKQSLMLEFNPSEYARVRLQYARDRSREGAADNQLLLQFIVSLGAHGAHRF